MQRQPHRWKQDYERDGYAVVADVAEPKLLEKLRAGIERITRDPDAAPPHLRQHLDFERDFIKRTPGYNELTSAQVGNAVRNIMELPLFATEFAELILHQGQLDVLEALFATPEFSFHNYKCIIKAAEVSSRFNWHRDLPYLEHSTPNLITSMICLDEMTEANGATVVIPGSHRVPMESVTSADTDIPEEKLPAGERVAVCCPAGSLVLFHVNLVHGGGANRTACPRRNVISIWAGPDTYPTTAARYAYQDLMPRSADPARRRQVQLTFPHLHAR
ncbi:MAG TPA: phytanoyl-CoA dioxygenase family protein [Tepidisphaeraceae bacterium]|jgi:ectoine hydroxylase-related dioxygenase (phytanoyl-CoA dioxygenase family)|nr:phytanoyl-CoA dioxygenase family protein [Tepidisphaeraceae bacterium]